MTPDRFDGTVVLHPMSIAEPRSIDTDLFEDERREEKARLFEKGLRLARDGDVLGACDLLERAHELVPDDRNVEATLQVMRRRLESRQSESFEDAFERDSGSEDSGSEDSGSEDSGSEDTDSMDSGPPQSQAREVGPADRTSATAETSGAEAGEESPEQSEATEEQGPGIRSRVASTWSRIATAPKGAWSRIRSLKPTPKPRVFVEDDVPYFRDGKREHELDVHRLEEIKPRSAAILYFGARGYETGSRTARQAMTRFVQHGYVGVNVRYRSVPNYPFPAALIDAARAFLFFVERADAFDAARRRVILAGDATGANIALALTLACCQRREEKWARGLYDLGIKPRALICCAGYLQTSTPERLESQEPTTSKRTLRALKRYSSVYRDFHPRLAVETKALADPIVALENTPRVDRALPPCFAVVGASDVVADDSRRLEAAYAQHGASCSLRWLDGSVAGQMASEWKREDSSWLEDLFNFLQEHD